MKVKTIICATIFFTSIIGICGASSEQVNDKSNEGQRIIQSVTSSSDPTNFFRENSVDELFDGRTTFDEYLLYGMRSLKLVSGYDNDVHRYDSNSGLVKSFARNLSYTDDIGHLAAHIDASELDLLKDETELTVIENELAQSRCKYQLETILDQTSRLYTDFNSYSDSKQLSLINFLDSYGAPSSQLLKGDFMWLGSYQQCSESRLDFTADGDDNKGTANENQASNLKFGGRYCVANFRDPSWPSAVDGNNHDNHKVVDEKDQQQNPNVRLGSESIKLGICLPESCNSISIRRHSEKIDAIVKLTRLNQIPYNAYKLTHLYCLPDDSSPLRQFTWSARIFIVALASWLTVVVYFSVKYELIRMKHLNGDAESRLILRDAEASKSMNIFALRLSWSRLFQDSNGGERSFPLKTTNDDARVSLCENYEAGQESGIESSDSESTSSTTSNVACLEKRSYSPAADAVSIVPEHNKTRQQRQENTNKRQQQQSLKIANMIEGVKSSSQMVSTVFGQKINPIGIVNGVLEAHEDSIVQHRKDPGRKSSAVVTVNDSELKQPAAENNCKSAKIDLAVIDGIKVLSMIWLISAHTLLFFIRNISNARDFWSILRDARFMSIMAGIFPVDSFFTITGILTAFLKFNKNDGEAMGKVRHWMEAFVHRYLRFMPMYLIVFWYTRDVSEYIGDGPLWDYATTSTGLRSTCKLESFSVPLFFQANFKPLDKHCVKPAWYLANDYQYLLITPIFMSLLMKSTLFGYMFIGLSILVSLSLQFSTVYFSNEIEDFQTLINFKPMFGAYVLKNLWRLYVLPYNRIPPYLIGILTGHLMYSLNKCSSSKPKVEHVVKSQSQDSLASLSSTRHRSTSDILKAPEQQYSIGFIGTLSNYIGIKVWIPLVLLISIIYLPLLTKVSTQEGLSAKIGSSSIIAMMRLVWSAAMAGFIYICSTRSIQDNKNCNNFIIRLLSLQFWKPWSKIGLSALLIQWEVISYLAQTQISLPNLTISFIAAIILLCIFVTYSIALITYLTIEYPLSQVERLYIHPIFNNK